MKPKVSVVIPSLSPERATSLRELRSALAAQTLASEVIVVEGVSPQGAAINRGAERATGRILVVVDDDSSIRDPRLIEKLVAVLDHDPRVGMAGASVRTPEDANLFQRLAAREFPRFNVPVVSRVTDSDLACHGCAAFPLALFRSIGGEREEIVRGLDPDLRQRLRDRGYRVVLVPDCVVYHPLPASLRGFVKTFLRNGAGSARAQREHPDLVFETDESLESHDFQARRSFAYRVLRFPLRVLWALLTLRPLRALAYACYALGYVQELRRLQGPAQKP